MVSVDAVANHVRKHYSAHGAEVGAIGQRSVTVSLPQEMPLTGLIADLWNEFEATTEIAHAHSSAGASLVVWLASDAPPHAHNDTRRMSIGPLLCAAIVVLCACTLATTEPLQALYNNMTWPLNISKWIVLA